MSDRWTKGRTLADANRPGWKGIREVEGDYFTLGRDGKEPAAVCLEPDPGRAGNLCYPVTRSDADDGYTLENLEGRRFAYDDYNDQDARLYDVLHGAEQR